MEFFFSSEGGVWVGDGLRLLTSPFTTMQYAVIAFGFLLFLALWFIGHMWWKQKQANAGLDAAIATLASVKDEQDFSAEFGTIDHKIKLLPGLKRPWEDGVAPISPDTGRGL